MFDELEYGSFYWQVLQASREGRLFEAWQGTMAAIKATPWWRPLRRFHLERQLAVLEVAGLCYFHGQLRGVQLTVEQKQVRT